VNQRPVPRDPGRDENLPGGPAGPADFPELGTPRWRLLPPGKDPMDDPAVREASLDSLADDEDPGDLDLYQDPDSAPPPGLDDAELAVLIAEAREVTEDQARADALAARLGMTAAMAAVGAAIGRRGPGMRGSAQSFPGEYTSRAAGFATGKPLDAAPGCPTLGLFAEDAAGDDDRYAGATDDELLGAICAWDRAEAHMSARKHAAVAELIRRRPAPGCRPEGPARVPTAWDEFSAAELAPALGQSRGAAEDLLGLAHDLEVKLPGTKAVFRAGIVNVEKAEIIAAATAVLDPDEARAAEALVLDRAGYLTPGGLRSAIARAVMEIAPEKAKKRREQAARDARVERWAEDSGNAALAGRELPPAEVLAADQRVTAWAKELKKAGLDGTMDELRARAYLDILLGIDSRPFHDGTHGDRTGGGGPEDGGPEDGGPEDGGPEDGGPEDGGPEDGGSGPPGSAGPVAGTVPPGFAGKVNLTIPLATLLGLASRPGQMSGIGPVDPALAQDLAAAAARNPRSTWCVTVTDSDGRAIGHGCAQPQPASHHNDTAKRGQRGPPGEHDPPGKTIDSGPPEFTFTASGQCGPRGGFGTWRLATGNPGQRDLLIAVRSLATENCDHRYESRGHDPSAMLRHLSQVRHATCTGPACRRPAGSCDFEHNTPYEAGGRTCLCNGHPKCRHDHRMKQDARWASEQLPNGNVRWTTPSGRQYTTEPTRHPI
jgi:Domain of unknown function (DUF222)